MGKLVEKAKNEIRYKKYLNLIYKAMTLVGNKYGAIITQYSDDLSKIEICERNYVIFLAFVLGEMQTGKKRKVISDNLFINGEICKQLDIMSDTKIRNAYSEFIKLKSEKEKNSPQTNSVNDDKKGTERASEKYKNVRPDFVVHESHEKDYEIDGQKIIIEAKTTNHLIEMDFWWDLLKLNVYIDELKFENAIYIIVNANKNDVDNYVKSYYDKIKYKSGKINKLWFFMQNWDNDKMGKIHIYQLEG